MAKAVMTARLCFTLLQFGEAPAQFAANL